MSEAHDKLLAQVPHLRRKLVKQQRRISGYVATINELTRQNQELRKAGYGQVAQMLFLQTDESAFRKVANRHW